MFFFLFLKSVIERIQMVPNSVPFDRVNSKKRTVWRSFNLDLSKWCPFPLQMLDFNINLCILYIKTEKFFIYFYS